MADDNNALSGNCGGDCDRGVCCKGGSLGGQADKAGQGDIENKRGKHADMLCAGRLSGRVAAAGSKSQRADSKGQAGKAPEQAGARVDSIFDIKSNKKYSEEVHMLKNLAALIKVKTIVTLIVIGIFAVLALRGAISADNVMITVSTVIAFYFGTQAEKKEGK